MVPMEKRCAHCKEAKQYGEFYRSPQTRDGHNAWCKACVDADKRATAAALRRLKQTHPDEYEAYKAEALHLTSSERDH